jgi:chromosome segregation ATPase
MNKTYYLIIAVLVLGVVTIVVLNKRSDKKKELEIQKDVARIQQALEPNLEKLMELKSNLKEELNKLKENTKNLKEEIKSEAHAQKETIKEKGHDLKAKAEEKKDHTKEKIHELKEEAKAKRDVLKKQAGDIKDEAVQTAIERYDNAVRELEELEAEIASWKESFAATLKEKKAKASKETHAKLEAARDKLTEINDRIGRAIEKAGKAMQHHD